MELGHMSWEGYHVTGKNRWGLGLGLGAWDGGVGKIGCMDLLEAANGLSCSVAGGLVFGVMNYLGLLASPHVVAETISRYNYRSGNK